MRESGLPEPGEQAREHSQRVVRLIGDRIAAGEGWISFAEYMDLALHAPGFGYYAAGSQKFGGAGDFVTAPEISPLFGRSIARQIDQVLKCTDGDIVELGAGSGALSLQILSELEIHGRLPDRYCILEPSPELGRRQRETVLSASPTLARRIEWISDVPQGFSGVIVANEVLDALPVHLVVWAAEDLLERGVALRDGALIWQDRPAEESLRSLAADIVVSAPYLSEISPAVRAMTASLVKSIDRGLVLLIDYGFGRQEYYHPQRSSGTLMCHYRHRAHADPFYLPGLQDITAHIDFTAVAESGVDAGGLLAGYSSQAQFLLNCGIAELMSEGPPPDSAAYVAHASAFQKLVSPAEMGELFKVLALTRGVDMPLLGFTEGERSAWL